jgi:hypothetical protein
VVAALLRLRRRFGGKRRPRARAGQVLAAFSAKAARGAPPWPPTSPSSCTAHGDEGPAAGLELELGELAVHLGTLQPRFKLVTW